MPQQTANVNLIKGDSIDPKTDYRDALPVNMYAVKKPVLGAAGYMLCYPGLSSILSENLWKTPLDFIGPGWTDNGDGSFSCDGTQVSPTSIGVFFVYNPGDIASGSIKIISISSGMIQQRYGSTLGDEYTTIGSKSQSNIAVTGPVISAAVIASADFIGTVRLVDFRIQQQGSGIDRAGVYNDRFDTQYRISGTDMIEVDSDGVSTVLGTVPGTKQSTMENFYSFNTQGVIADGKFFLYDPVGGFREVTDPDVGDPIDGVWVDGFYFMTDGEFLFHTDIADEESIDPLNFATAEFMPDKSLGLAKTQDNKVMVFGRYTVEYFINRATANFAFERVATRAQKIGIVATHAKAESEGSWYITGGRKMDAVGVHMITLGNSKKVSTREIDKILAQYTEPELADMRMESRMEDDVYFILVHLPNETLCYNATIAKTVGVASAWTIVKTDVAGNAPYRAINGVFDARVAKWVYGDKIDATIGRLDNAVFTHYDETVEWLLFTPFLDLDSLSIDEIEIETIPGRTAFDDASVFFSMTNDGETYSKEYLTEYGASLNRNKRFFLRRLGDTRDWVGFKFRGATKSRMAFALLKVTYG